MEILVAIAGKLAEYTVAPIGHQVGYLAHYKRNHRNLQTKLEDLRDARGEVHCEVVQEKRRGKIIKPTVRNWETKVDAIVTEAEEFLKDGRHAQTQCLHGFCPHLVLRYQLSKKSTKLVEKIDELYGKDFSNVAYDAPVQDPYLLSTGNYHAFASRDSTVREVMDKLRNPDTEMILVWGIGGVGKTTLVEEVLRQAKHDNLFDDVVMVRDVKGNPGQVQKEIATKLGMSIDENHTLAERAPILCGRIKDNRVLVALDDVWEKIDLVAIGLPRLMNCKMLLTSRIRKELSSDMRRQIDIPLDVLNEDEAWSLFEKMVGDVVKDSRIRREANEVAKKCGRLPILIVTVARALKDRYKMSAWKDTLRRLGGFDKKELKEKAYLALEWSYNQLEDKELKPLFLLCGIIVVKNHINLGDLLKYGFGLGLIKNVSTIEEARYAVDANVEKLKDSCLLLDSDKNMHVRMHDLVCEVAAWIASREQHVLSVEYGAELKEWPDKDFFKRCTKMSIKSSNIPMLSQVPAEECQKLEMIYLKSEDVASTEIPSSFFTEMKKLKVLGITRLWMTSLPSSLECLKNLQTLSLEAYFLGDVTPVGHLTNLEILSFAGSSIRQLPKEIGELIRLKWLDLSDCSRLKVISPNVLSRLEKLEELTMRNVSLFWEGERGRSNIASLSELKNLSHLTALEIYIKDANILPPNLFSSNLVRYQIYIGEVWKPGYAKNMAQTTLNELKLELTSSNELDQGIITLLKKCDDLCLDGSESVSSIVRQLNAEDFRQLMHLRLRNKVDFTYIINSKAVFPNLTTLSVERLNHLNFLLSFSMAKSLVALKHLEVSECEIMEEIVSARDQPNGENIDIVFCKLERLELSNLPSLARFCTESSIELSPVKKFDTELGASIVDPTSSKKLDGKSGTAVLTCLFDAQIKFPSLERLEFRGLGKLQTLWNNKKLADQDSFQKLREVDVSCCESLMNIFVPRMMGRLNALETLWIGSCGSLEAVFEVGRTDVEEISADTSSSSPGNLKPFHCPSLGSVDIQGCERLKNIFPASVARGLQKLYVLDVETCNEVEEIIGGEQGLKTELPRFEFPKVTRLYLRDLPKLCRFYPGMHVSKWPLLKELDMSGCNRVKMFAAELPNFKGHPLIEQSLFLIEKDSFPNLECLKAPDLSVMSYGPSSPVEVVSRLKSITFGSRDRTTPFSKQATIDFLQKLQKLATLSVRYSDSTELFVSQEINSGEEIHPVGLSGVKTLKIYYMDKLLQLGNGNSQTAGPLFPNLDTLDVGFCMLLKSLESSAISFRYLTNLEVYKCGRLEYLTSYSVAKSLTQLTRLEVGDCAVLREIIGASNEDDHDTEGSYEIAFSRLQYVELWALPSLRGFCSGNCIVRLPSSTELNVMDCPIELKISSEGILLRNEKPKPQEDLDDDHNEGDN